jgi:hypothetical protein
MLVTLEDVEEVVDAVEVLGVVLLVMELEDVALEVDEVFDEEEVVSTSAPTTIITMTTTAAPTTVVETPRLVRIACVCRRRIL